MRMYRNHFIIVSCLAIINCAAAQTVAPFSQYGQIQGVKNYSSNPFWNPSGPYNQRMPQAVYVDGPEINAGDCQRTVSALVANFCDAQNKCAGTQLSDVRPTLMLQLSQLPGHNFAASCAGYIDTEYKKYMSQNSFAAVQSASVVFPDVKSVSAGATQRSVADKNIPQWQRDVDDRAQKLQALQAQQKQQPVVTVPSWQIDAPAVVSDLGADERTEIKAQGYEPFKDMSAYHPLKNIVMNETAARVVLMPPVDVCANPQAATAMDENGANYIYTFYDDVGLRDQLQVQVTTPLTWGVKFKYGTIIGKTDLREADEDGWRSCICQIEQYVATDGKTYAGFQEITPLRVQYDGDRALNRCNGACVGALSINATERDDFFGDAFPHTDPYNCEPEFVYYKKLEDGDGLNPDVLKQTTEEFCVYGTFYSRGGVEVCQATEPDAWIARFWASALEGKYSCEAGTTDKYDCKCKLTKVRTECWNKNYDPWNEFKNSCEYNFEPNTGTSSGDPVTLMEFDSQNACNTHCAKQCAFAGANGNKYFQEFRERMLGDHNNWHNTTTP